MLQLPPLPHCLAESASSLLYPRKYSQCPYFHSLWWMFDKNISIQILLQVGHASSSQCKSQGGKLYRKWFPCTITSVYFHVFFPGFTAFFGGFSLLIVLYWVSAHPWHCDLLCCFIWHLSKMQLVVTALFISILYEQSQHLFDNVAQLLRGSFQTTWNFSLFIFWLLSAVCPSSFCQIEKLDLANFAQMFGMVNWK